MAHCPTPSAKTNRAVEAAAIAQILTTFLFGICSAFLPADEDCDETYAWPPKEYLTIGVAKSPTVFWKLLRSLRGSRTAGSNFRDLVR